MPSFSDRPVKSPSSSSSRKPKSSESVVVPENKAIEDSRDVVRAVIPELRQIGAACKHGLENDGSLLGVAGVNVNGSGVVGKSATTPPRRRKTHSMMTNGSVTTGVINPDELYTIATFKHRLGIQGATLRAARRAGLKVYYVHKHAYVYGRDWIEYVLNSQSSRDVVTAAVIA